MPLFDRSWQTSRHYPHQLLADYLLNQLKNEVSAHSNSVWLLNKDGYWLKGKNREDEFGFMF